MISAGHPRADVLNYTPREAMAWLNLAWRRRKREAAIELSIAALAGRGDQDEIDRKIREWSGG